MNIILITSSYPLYPDDSSAAAGLFVRDFAAELSRQGHLVRVLTQDRPGERDDDPAFEVIRYPWWGNKPLSTLSLVNPLDHFLILSLLLKGIRELYRMINRNRPDLILALWAVPAGLFAIQAWKKWGIPYRVWALGSDIWGYGSNPLTKPIVRQVLRHTEMTFADGIELAETASVLAGKKVEFLPSSRKLPEGLNPPPELDNGKINFLFIGRYHPNKGPDILLRAICMLDTDMREDFHFHIFGGGPIEEDLKGFIEINNIKNCVSLVGFAEKATAAAFLQHSHALVIPSRIESIPVILSDAAQAKCPLIVTDVGDMGELVSSSGAGIIVRPEPESLKNGIMEMARREKEEFHEGLRTLAGTFSLERSAKRAVE